MKPSSSSSKRKFSAETLFDNKVLSDTKEEVPLNSSYLIAIVGGGIAGLGAALALQQRGFRVKVYERDLLFEDRRQGYGLTLTNNPKGPLAELDLLDECITRDCPSNAHWIFAPQGNVLGYYGRSFKNVGEAEQIINGVETSDTPHGKASKRPKLSNSLVEGRGNLRIPRQNLRRMMLEKLNPGTVSWGMKLVDYVEDLDGVRAQFQSSKAPICENKNGIINTTDNIATTEILDLNQENSNNIVEIYADVLVGADGIRSIVRQLRGKKLGVQSNSKPIVESSPLHYVGVAVILGITTATHPLINQQGFYCLDGVNRLFTMPFEDGDVKPFKSSGAEGCDGETAGNGGEFRAGEGEDESGGHGEIDGSSDADEYTLDEYTSENRSAASHSSFARKNIGRSTGLKVPLDEKRKTKLTMWQLSFSDFTEEEGIRLRSASAEDLLKEALRRCNGWFDPVCDMIKCTPKREVWGTGLYDRNPMPLRGKDQGSRVTVMGDACHPMSMFKGQGANQALHDGPLLASWLDCGSGNGNAIKKTKKSQIIVPDIVGTVSANTYRSVAENLKLNKAVCSELTNQNIYTRLRCFEREMVARTASKVQASREAATQLHSPAVLTDSFRVEGVKAEMHGQLLQKLKKSDIGAHLSGDLEGIMKNVLQELLADVLCQ